MTKKLNVPKIGMRTVKTAVAVFICLLLYEGIHALTGLVPADGKQLHQLILLFFGHSNILYAIFAAVICMQTTLENSVKSGLNRLIGTAVGGVLGILFLFLKYVPYFALFRIFLISLGVIIVIYICNLLRVSQSIAIALVVFVIITAGVQQESPFLYALNRCVDTAIGTLISILVNALLRSPKGTPTHPEGQEPIAPEETK